MPTLSNPAGRLVVYIGVGRGEKEWDFWVGILKVELTGFLDASYLSCERFSKVCLR